LSVCIFISTRKSWAGEGDLKNYVDVEFQPDGKHTRIGVGSKIIEGIREVGIDLQAPCGDRGVCGRCKVVLTEGGGLLNQPTGYELRAVTLSELRDGYRLACQCTASRPGSIVVAIPPESRIGHQRMVVQGLAPKLRPTPMVKKISLNFREGDFKRLRAVKADSELLTSALRRAGCSINSLSLEAMRALPDAMPRSGGSVTVAVWGGREALSVEAGDTSSRLFGFAVDIGTTKLAGYLVDLKSGRVLATSSLPNPQIAYGGDLISRIAYYSQSAENAGRLKSAVVNGVNRLIEDACRSAGVDASEIYDVTAVGNTAMHHIFFGISPKYVALSPFPVAVKSSFNLKAKELGLNVNPAAYLHSLPLIAGFVGADAVADILATEIYRFKGPSLLIDIGTNAEIVVGGREGLTCCSSPAGPAFEGAHIKHGMRASSGAIEAVWIDPDDLSVGYKTVDDVKPRGICGSGIIDAVAQMFKAGVLNRSGGIDRGVKSPRIRVVDGKPEFVVAWGGETEGGVDITITQDDVQEVLLAKAAIYTGVSVTLKRLGLKPRDIRRLYIAGAFGTYIDLTNSLILGIYPDIPFDRVRFVGNTAGSGARMTLLSKQVRVKAERIVDRARYIELAADPLFEKEFTDSIWLPHRDIELFPTVRKLLKGLGRL